MNNQVTITLSTQEAFDVWEAIQVMRNELSIARHNAENPEDFIDPAIYEALGDKVKGQF